MPSALLSAGGSVFSSTPGPPIGEPLSAMYRRVRSGLIRIPRGRLPSAIVATADWVVPSMTVMLPPVSLVTYTPKSGSGGGDAGAAVADAAADGVDAAGG